MGQNDTKQMKKTTRIRYCQLPKGSSSTTLTRKTGQKLKDTDLLDIFEDVVKNPYLPYAMQILGMINQTAVDVECVNDDDEKKEKQMVYTVLTKKKYSDIDPEEVYQVLRREAGTRDPEEIAELMTTLMGIQYILHSKKQFEIDVVIVEGNTVEEIEEYRKTAKANGTW